MKTFFNNICVFFGVLLILCLPLIIIGHYKLDINYGFSVFMGIGCFIIGVYATKKSEEKKS